MQYLCKLLGNIGACLAFQGIAQMLTPVPDIPEKNKILDYLLILVEYKIQVVLVLLFLSFMVKLTGSVVISAGIETAQVEV